MKFDHNAFAALVAGVVLFSITSLTEVSAAPVATPEALAAPGREPGLLNDPGIKQKETATKDIPWHAKLFNRAPKPAPKEEVERLDDDDDDEEEKKRKRDYEKAKFKAYHPDSTDLKDSLQAARIEAEKNVRDHQDAVQYEFLRRPSALNELKNGPKIRVSTRTSSADPTPFEAFKLKDIDLIMQNGRHTPLTPPKDISAKILEHANLDMEQLKGRGRLRALDQKSMKALVDNSLK